jgi:hypothetical protein
MKILIQTTSIISIHACMYAYLLERYNSNKKGYNSNKNQYENGKI